MPVPDLLEQLTEATVYDLSQPYYPGMPHYPTHPPFLFGLSKQHGDYVLANDASSASESIALGCHTGTHIDALCHYSQSGRLHGDLEIMQSAAGGLSALSIDTVAPILRRGVLLDIAGSQGVDALPADFEITPDHLEHVVDSQGVSIHPGDVVLLRSGWGRFWDDPPRYISSVHGPGPGLEAARWLSWHSIFAAGADTVAFEKVPSPEMSVHVHLLVESGIHIIECLNLDRLAQAGVWMFLFVALPLKIQGATASPIRPVAIA